jgi:hypothetical protein
MTHKAIRYSAHATTRLRERGITRVQVRRALAVGATVASASAEGVREARLALRRGTLVVFFREGAEGIYIITVFFEA